MIKYSTMSIKCILIFLFILTFGSKAEAVEGTIVTKAGDRYDNVKYKIDNFYKVVTVYLEKDQKNISFPDIKAIYDTEGKNIAGDLLKGYYKPEDSEKQLEIIDTVKPVHPVVIDSVNKVDSGFRSKQLFKDEWRSNNDQVFKEAAKKYWNVGFRLGCNFSVPLGTYYDGINSSIGFEGDFLVAVTNKIAIRVIISKAGLKWDDSFRLYSLNPEYEIISQEFKLNVIRYMLAVQYYNRFGEKIPAKTMWYAVTGLGAIAHKTTFECKYINTITSEIYLVEDDYQETKFAMNLGFGIIQMFSKNVGLDFGLNWDLVFIGKVENEDDSWNYYSDVQTAGILDFKLSLIALF
ncbi:MAG: hypothetical protein PHN52_01500 [candidate division Zixibacteria bacterium]|nr:hypothetical protein [candidate division Zixibacteria bacterium]